jgi:hypothetical protein
MTGIYNISLSIVMTLLSTVILVYISMATMIGPWIAPTIVIMASLISRLRLIGTASRETSQNKESLALIQTAASVGGIVATAVGFTLPTLYFLDPAQFNELLSKPLFFSFLVGSICITAGGLGIFLAKSFRKKFLEKDNLPFPVSHMIHKTITSQSESKQAKKLIAGFSGSMIFSILRDKLSTKTFFIFKSIFGNHLPITLSPMFWAIGFIAGTSVAVPLFVGMISKYLVISPLNNHSLYLPFKLFPILDPKLFTMAFASGLVLAGVIPSFLKYPSIIWSNIKQFSGYTTLSRKQSVKNVFDVARKRALIPIIATSILFLLFKFPPLSLLIIIPLTTIAAYNISAIAGEIGLAQIGRFVTLVMIPTMLLFKLNVMQITLLCVFVASCITATTDLLFGYKVGELCKIPQKKIYFYQWLGLIVTAISAGFFVWLLCTNLQLGTAELFAQRAKSRAILITSFSFNWTVVFLGFLFGLGLKRLKISPTMVFGGLLMPNQLTIGLLIGSLGTLFVKDKKEHFTLFSGIFTAESLWLIVSILWRLI